MTSRFGRGLGALAIVMTLAVSGSAQAATKDPVNTAPKGDTGTAPEKPNEPGGGGSNPFPSPTRGADGSNSSPQSGWTSGGGWDGDSERPADPEPIPSGRTVGQDDGAGTDTYQDLAESKGTAAREAARRKAAIAAQARKVPHSVNFRQAPAYVPSATAATGPRTRIAPPPIR